MVKLYIQYFIILCGDLIKLIFDSKNPILYILLLGFWRQKFKKSQIRIGEN